ncbi:MAG: vitamin K epoxide reductase family protein [Candidatus Bipolaricaulia bacterium]
MRRSASMQVAIIVLAILGLADSAYLLYEHLGHEIVCIGSGCSIVDQSVYAEVFGIPMSVMGLVGYLFILGAAVAGLHLRGRARAREWAKAAVYGFALIGLLYSGYLTYLELFVIRAICTWCVVSAVIVAAILVLAVIELWRRERWKGEMAG